MEFYHQDQLMMLYDSNADFRKFYSKYFNEHILTIKEYRTERNNIKWDHHDYKKIPTHFWAAIYKENNEYAGITFLLKVTNYGLFTVLPKQMFTRHWFVYGTYVSPEYRNKGINKFMLSEIITKLKPKGILSIIADSNIASIRANAGFEKLDIPSKYKDTHWYLKRIDKS